MSTPIPNLRLVYHCSNTLPPGMQIGYINNNKYKYLSDVFSISLKFTIQIKFYAYTLFAAFEDCP